MHHFCKQANTTKLQKLSSYNSKARTFRAQGISFQVYKKLKQMTLNAMYMFPTAVLTVFLWRSIRAWAVIAAHFTNHTDFLDSRVLTLTVIGWHLLESLLTNKVSFSEDQKVATQRLQTLHAHTQTCNLPQENEHFRFIFIRISISFHQSDHPSH